MIKDLLNYLAFYIRPHVHDACMRIHLHAHAVLKSIITAMHLCILHLANPEARDYMAHGRMHVVTIIPAIAIFCKALAVRYIEPLLCVMLRVCTCNY